MSRRPKYREQDFPPAGTVFVAPTGDGRYAAGRVLRREFHGGAQAALIAGCSWLGNEVPQLDSPELRETLILSHHNWQSVPNVFWTFHLMPPDFIIVGQIELSPSDLAASSDGYTGWQSVLHSLAQWRWDFDREALLQDEARQAAEKAEAQRQRAVTRAELMKSLTLSSLLDRAWFATWGNVDSDLPLHECRASMKKLVQELQAAPKLTLSVVKKHLKQSVNEVNRLNAKHNFISTIEREDICEAYDHIACAAKFPRVTDQIEEWREW